MKKSVLSQHEQGSAEQVLAHAAWQRSRGRNPSMSFVGEHNPRKALLLANSVIHGARRTKIICSLATVLMRYKSYNDMSNEEIKAVMTYIITSSSSEAEVQQRLRDELGYPYGDVLLRTTIPNDTAGREARELVRGIGGLVMKNGAIVMAMMNGHEGLIIL